MRFLQMSVLVTAAAVCVAGVVGCGKTAPTVSPAPDVGSSMDMAQTDEQGHMDHEGHVEPADHAQHDGKQDGMAKMKEALAGLPAEDRASAEKQHFCPVSGNMLGTMGVPTKVKLEGQDVWICCPGCEDQLREKSEEYLAKLSH